MEECMISGRLQRQILMKYLLIREHVAAYTLHVPRTYGDFAQTCINTQDSSVI